MSVKLGMNCKLYFAAALINDTDNLPADADWTEIKNVKDLTLNLSTGEADVTTRENNGWKATAATLKDGSVEFEMMWDTSKDGFDELRDAWKDSTEIGMAVMDGDIDTGGSEGLAGNFTVTNFTRGEPLAEGVTAKVTIKPSSYDDWYEVAGS